MAPVTGMKTCSGVTCFQGQRINRVMPGLLRISSSISWKIALLTSSLILLVLSLTTGYGYLQLYRQLEAKFGWTLEHIATTAAISIDGQEHSKIRDAGDENLESFRTIYSHLQEVQQANGLGYDTIYTFHRKAENLLSFGVMLHPTPFVGSEYPIPKENQDLIHRVFEQKSSGHSGIYTDPHGTWISGYAPVIDENNQVQGILAVDYKVDKFVQALQNDLYRGLFIDFLLLLLGILLSYWMARRIARPIERLNTAVDRIIKEDYDVYLNSSSSDEVGRLTTSFNQMAARLRERIMILEYIPEHTRQLISRLTTGELKGSGEKREVAVLFSDIRGFTAFSNRHESEEVIASLNAILGFQADVIEKHGGYVDKYVGDEVVALFEGPERGANAARAAASIQAFLGNESNALFADIVSEIPDFKDLRVGIGISMGQVLMGNIGSARRREYTVIGDNVNLAARLCNAAGPGETFLSSNTYWAIQGSDVAADLPMKLRGMARVKGFDQEMHVYSLIGK